MKDKLTELYDDLYINGYHQSLGFTHSKNLILKGILKYIKKGESVIDVGCSNGTAMKLLIDNGYNASGVDISKVAIDIAIKNGLTNCKVSKASDIDYLDNSFSSILCTDVLEHVPEEDIDKTFSEFDRITIDGGYLFLKIATKEEFNRKWDNITNKHGYDNLHILVKDQKFWLDFFKSKRLEVIEILETNNNYFEIILKKK